MKVLVKNTFNQMFKLIPMIITSIIALLLGILMAYGYTKLVNQNLTYEKMVSNIEIIFIIINFVFLTGMILWIIVASSATSLFASEIHEGTMRLLLAKQISRLELVAGKIVGMLLGSMAYLGLIYLIFILSFVVISGVEKDILILVLKYTGSFIIFGLLMIFIVGGIGSFLSSCFKRKVPAIIILIILMMLIFFIIPIARVLIGDIYQNYHLYYLDINYHLASIYSQFIDLLGGINASLDELSSLNLFTNLFPYVTPDYDLTASVVDCMNKTINGTIIMAIYLSLAAILYYFSYRRILKMDI